MSKRRRTRSEIAAAAYIERGWCAIPIAKGAKNPGRRGWESERYTAEDIPRVFRDKNIGIHVGASSGGLVDIDLDQPAARALAAHHLPPTDRRHGRASTPDAHWWYVASPIPEKTTRYKDDVGETLLELRSSGGQTVVPPSIHPGGESIEWSATGEPTAVDGNALQAAVERLAAAAMLANHWTEGSRHDLALAVAGTLLRHGWTPEETEQFIVPVARAAGDGEQEDDHRRAVWDTHDALRTKQPATGIPTLVDICGPKFAPRFLRWLGIQESGLQRRLLPSRQEKPERPSHLQLVEVEEAEEPEEDQVVSPEWAIPAEAPAVALEDLPYWLQRITRHVEPYLPMFIDDWPIIMALPFWSILWPSVRIQNLNLAIWSLGIAPQGGGKNTATDELKRVIEAVSQKDLEIYTAGSPEGMWDHLAGDQKKLLAYHDEYAGYLKLLNREHMSSAKEALCGLYDGRGVGYMRAQKKGVRITDPIVAVAATTTARMFRDHADVDDMFNGYLSRFIFCTPDYRQLFPDVFMGSVDADREQLIRELVDFTNRYRGVQRLHYAETESGRDPEILLRFRAHHGMDSGRVITPEESMEDRTIPPGRLLARIKKIAGLLAMSEAQPEIAGAGRIVYIQEEHLRAAVTIVERGRFYASRALTWIGENEEVRLSDRALQVLIKNPKGVTRRELCRKLHAKSADVRNALDLLRDAGLVASQRQLGTKAEYWLPTQAKAAGTRP